MNSELLSALRSVIEVLKRLEIAYRIGGSLASSAYGIPRSTLDVDLVADLAAHHAPILAEEFGKTCYVDEQMVRTAIESCTSFNLVHLASMLKFDVFVPKATEYDQISFSRCREEALESGSDAHLYSLVTPEDLILRKLLWYVSGGMASDQQIKDVQGVLKVQSDALDWSYLLHWAKRLDVDKLLKTACTDSGVEPT